MLDWRTRAVGRTGSDLEPARQIMMGELDHLHAARHSDSALDARLSRLRLRIGLCRDAAGLWFLRSDLMQVLSTSLGEYEARQRMTRIDLLFEGLLPASLNSRPAPLR